MNHECNEMKPGVSIKKEEGAWWILSKAQGCKYFHDIKFCPFCGEELK